MRILILVTVLYLFCGCTREIEFSAEEQAPLLVVNSIISNDETVEINLSHSVFLSEGGNKRYVKDADVKMYVNDNLKETLKNSFEGLYTSSYKPKIGDKIRIDVSKQGFKTTTATTIIPDIAENISMEKQIKNIGDKIKVDIKINFKDKLGLKNYYRVFVQNKFTDMKTNTTHIPYSRINVDLSNNSVLAFLKDKDVPLDNPIMIEDSRKESIYRNYFSDEIIDGKTYTLNFSFTERSIFFISKEYKNTIKIEFHSLSEDFYRYMLSKGKPKSYEDAMVEPVPIYSNITNGIGILGSYSKNVITFDIYQENKP